MKIKTDFVTNSSSTSFTLHQTLALELYGDNLNFDSLKEGLKKENRKFEFEKPYDNLIDIKIKETDFELVDSENNIESQILSSKYGNYEQEDGTETDEHQIIIESDIGWVYDSEEQKPVEYMIKLMKEILSSIKYKGKPFKASYVQYITEFTGDGWGGDPQGKYRVPSEAILQETMKGTIEFKEPVVLRNNGTEYIEYKVKEKIS